MGRAAASATNGAAIRSWCEANGLQAGARADPKPDSPGVGPPELSKPRDGHRALHAPPLARPPLAMRSSRGTVIHPGPPYGGPKGARSFTSRPPETEGLPAG